MSHQMSVMKWENLHTFLRLLKVYTIGTYHVLSQLRIAVISIFSANSGGRLLNNLLGLFTILKWTD